MDTFIIGLLMLGAFGIGLATITIASADEVGLWTAFKRLFTLKDVQ